MKESTKHFILDDLIYLLLALFVSAGLMLIAFSCVAWSVNTEIIEKANPNYSE